jgi:hypothetical protein
MRAGAHADCTKRRLSCLQDSKTPNRKENFMSIENMLLRTYANFDNAQAARRALLGAGFEPDQVSFTAKEDEAGPVAGNFMIDREKDPDSLRNPPDFSEGKDPNEVQDTTPVDWGRSYMLMIDAEDREQLQLATEIAERFGGVDIEKIIGQQSASSAG